MAIKDRYYKYSEVINSAVKSADQALAADKCVGRSCNVTTLLCATDGTNDVSVTLYDSPTDESGGSWSGISSPVGDIVFKGTNEGLQGFTGAKFPMETGCALEITCAGTFFITLGYNYDMCF